MKKLSFLLLLLVAGLFYTGCKDDDDPDPTPTPEPTTFTVTYNLSVFGGYTDLELSYFEANFAKKFRTSPKLPWEESLGNFNRLDSVALRASFTPLANKTIVYSYEITVKKGTSYSEIYTESDTIVTGSTVMPVFIEEAMIIE